jgi:hypothetical protein
VENLDKEKIKMVLARHFFAQGWKVAKTMVSNELEPNRKQFPDHLLPFILHGVLVCTRPLQKAQQNLTLAVDR